MEKEIIKMLKEMQMKMSNKGFDLWVKAIEMAYNKKEFKMADAYNMDYNANYGMTERNLRHSLSLINANKYFNIDYKITCKEFLYLCVNELKQRI